MEPTPTNEVVTENSPTKFSQNVWYRPLCKVTKTSKILAATVMILLPFVGGYVGYQFGSAQVPIQSVVLVSSKAQTTSLSEQNSSTSSENFPSQKRAVTVNNTNVVTPEFQDVTDEVKVAHPDCVSEVETVTNFEDLKSLCIGSKIGDLTLIGFLKNRNGTEIANFSGNFEAVGAVVIRTENGPGSHFVIEKVDPTYESLLSLGADEAGLNVLIARELDSYADSTDESESDNLHKMLFNGLRVYDPDISNWGHETEFVLELE